MLSPLYGQLSPLRVPTILAPDPDALAYIAAVETADGQALEDGVKSAYDKFFKGLKQDGIFSAIKASCILAGARTLSGSLMPLVGSAPTNSNFVAGDYNRKTGLVGNGTTKRLSTNRNQLNDPRDNMHLSVWVSSQSGSYPLASAGSNPSQLIDYRTRCRSTTIFNTPQVNHVGFYAMSRQSSTSYSVRVNNQTYTHAGTSGTPGSSVYTVFGQSTIYNSSRIAFYSIGESTSLEQFNARLSTLMTDLSAAIP
jgi:hypothetical protein